MDEIADIDGESDGEAHAAPPGPSLDKGHFAESACLNCGAALGGQYCSACGQKAHLHRTAGAFLHDIAHGVLHLEGKTWRTLPMLALRPGKLTRDYIDGHRARYVSPIAIFLFAVFLMFAVFQFTGVAPASNIGEIAATPASIEESERVLEELRSTREALGDNNPAAAEFDRQIAEQEEALASRRANPEENADAAGAEPDDTRVVYTGEQYLVSGLEDVRTGWSLVDKALEKWQSNPSLMAYKLQANSYKFSWLLIPLSLPFMWLLFAWRRNFGIYDHAVFVTYSLSFMTLMLAAMTLLALLGVASDPLPGIYCLIALVHIYKQLRGAYSLSRFSAAWRLMALSVLIFLILGLFVNLLLVLGMFG